jgi:CheY-like chemotaxis protein
MLESVFDLFTQVGGALERSQGGLGIGLSLARRLVELHGGSIRAQSAGANQGSTFVVELPVLEAPGPQSRAAGEAPRSSRLPGSRSILVVDDNQDAAESLGMLLELEGHQVRLAHTGQQALAIARLERPQVIFLDIGLPDIDGYQVAAAIRGIPALAGVLLVALTGWGAERDQQRARAAGIHLHLTKPVSPEQVSTVLARGLPAADA